MEDNERFGERAMLIKMTQVLMVRIDNKVLHQCYTTSNQRIQKNNESESSSSSGRKRKNIASSLH